MSFRFRYLIGLAFFFTDHQATAQNPPLLNPGIKMHNGVPSLFINDELQPPFAYMSYFGEEKYYREFAEAGLHIYNIPAYLGDRGINSTSGIGPFRRHIWKGKNDFDFTSIQFEFNEILRADPDAKVIIRLHLDPPLWWEEENPDEVCLFPDGSSVRTSFASMKWRDEAGDVLRTLVRWLLSSQYASNLLGIHVAGGYTEEWYYHFKDLFYDESPARKTAFGNWLKTKYDDNVGFLQEAWREDSVSFDHVVPADISGLQREKGWRSPLYDQKYFDTFDFHGELMANHILHFCEIVKEESQNTLLTGAFYGYHFFVSDPRRGHGALSKLLDSPVLDYLSSPNDYNRVAGEDWAPFAAIKSVQLHGKLWLAENDTRTSISSLLKQRAPHVDPPNDYYSGGVWIGPKDMDTSVSFLWKNLGRMLSYGYGGWWFDMWGGWFSDPQLLEVVKKGQEYFWLSDTLSSNAMAPEVVVIVDERLQFWDKSFGPQTEEIIGNRYALGKTGIPYDLLLRTDLDKVSKSDYKVIWFLGLMDLTEKETEFIKEFNQENKSLMVTDNTGTKIYGEDADPIHKDGKIKWAASELGSLWEEKEVHRYQQHGDVLYAGRGWLTIHTVNGGEKKIKLPFHAKVIDPLLNETIYDSTDTITLSLPPVSTKILRVIPSGPVRLEIKNE